MLLPVPGGARESTFIVDERSIAGGGPCDELFVAVKVGFTVRFLVPVEIGYDRTWYS